MVLMLILKSDIDDMILMVLRSFCSSPHQKLPLKDVVVVIKLAVLELFAIRERRQDIGFASLEALAAVKYNIRKLLVSCGIDCFPIWGELPLLVLFLFPSVVNSLSFLLRASR